MRNILLTALLFPLVVTSNEFYGRVAIDARSVTQSEKSKTDIENNESRAGFKGSFAFNKDNSNLSLIYQAEYGFDPVDGKERGDQGTLKQRNTFLGIKSKKYGTLMAGTHDTAFKQAQQGVDLFNDLLPDIKNILPGENRLEDFIGYVSPKFDNYFFKINSIKNPSSGLSNYKSYSLHYEGDNFRGAFAVDNSVQGFDSLRYSVLIPFGLFQLGLLYQESKKLSSDLSSDGKVISIQRKLSDKNKIKFQYAASDLKSRGGKNTTLGFDRLLVNGLTLFIFYSHFDSDTSSKQKEVFSVGIEYKF
ncbi:MAG: porin [Gammaproteobacteria bacterium]